MNSNVLEAFSFLSHVPEGCPTASLGEDMAEKWHLLAVHIVSLGNTEPLFQGKDGKLALR